MSATKKTKSVAKKTTSPRKNISKKAETRSPKGTTLKKEKNNIRRTVAKPSSSKAKAIIVDVIEDDVIEDDVIKDDVIKDDVDFNKVEEIDDLEIDARTKPRDFNKFESFSGLVSEDLDSQKNFFKELKDETEANLKSGENLDLQDQEVQDQEVQDQEVRDLLDLFEDEDSKPEKTKKINNSRRLNIYTKFVWKFLLIVFLLIVFVGYFSFSKLTIDIVPKSETLSESLLLKVSSDASGMRLLADPRENVSGLSKEITVSLSRNFPVSGEEFVGEEISGQVKIINNYSRSQSLVATTRLLSPDNKLFRIKEAVNIPAGEEAWVDIYVEKPSRDLAISPTTFTIPGLWVGLQDMIYAKSEDNFIFEQKKEKYVRASDLAAAEQEVGNSLLQELLVKIEAEKKDLELESGKKFAYVYLQEGETVITADAKAEDKKESFNVKADVTFRVVFFSKEESEKLAYGKLNLLLPSGKELMDFNPDNIIYSLESFNTDDNTATIKSTFSAKMILKAEGEVVKKDNLLHLNTEQLESYLSAQPEIKSFSLKFHPSFIKTAPRLVDRIKINLVEEIN